MQYEKPGCFGFASTFNIRSKVCQACSHKADCKSKAQIAISSIAERLNVDSVVKLMQEEAVKRAAVEKVEPKSKLNPLVEKLLKNQPVHVARAATMILVDGVNHRASLLKGVNSMKGKKPQSIDILFDLLIQGPVNRATYLNALKERAGYTQSTASSQASIGMSAVVAIGIAKEIEDGYIVIRGCK